MCRASARPMRFLPAQRRFRHRRVGAVDHTAAGAGAFRRDDRSAGQQRAGRLPGQVDLQGPGGDATRLHLPLWARLTASERSPSKVLLIDNDGSSSLELPDYSGYYGNALGELGAVHLPGCRQAGRAGQTLPDISELQTYEIVIWFTGDYFLPSGAAPVPPR